MTALPATRPGHDIADRLGGILPGPDLAGAACARRHANGRPYHPPEIFFPTTGEGYAQAKRVCNSCPVAAACLQMALVAERDTVSDWGRFGMYGGLTPTERAELSQKEKVA